LRINCGADFSLQRRLQPAFTDHRLKPMLQAEARATYRSTVSRPSTTTIRGVSPGAQAWKGRSA
jgi:hypothetical protein